MYTSLTLIKKYLEDCFSPDRGRTVFVDKEKIVLAPIEKDGQKEGEDIVITLLRIEEETSRKPQNAFRYAVDEHDGRKKVVSKNVNPDVCLNLYVLISSHAQDYETAIAQISDVIYWMNNINYNDGTNEIVKNGMQLELQSLSAEQHNSMWQTLGGMMVPSVVYKVRMVTISAETREKPVDVVDNVLLTLDSGSWSAISAKLHAGGKLTEAEKKLLCQVMVELYAEPIDPLVETPGEDYPDSWKRRREQLDYWRKETWHDAEINSLNKTDADTYNQRLYAIRSAQQDALLEALKAINAKPVAERTEVEQRALSRALEDEEIKNKI